MSADVAALLFLSHLCGEEEQDNPDSPPPDFLSHLCGEEECWRC